MWPATVSVYVQEGKLWACMNAHLSVHGQEDQGIHVIMDGEAACLHACVPVCGTSRRQACGHCYCPMGEKHFRICLMMEAAANYRSASSAQNQTLSCS